MQFGKSEKKEKKDEREKTDVYDQSHMVCVCMELMDETSLLPTMLLLRVALLL